MAPKNSTRPRAGIFANVKQDVAAAALEFVGTIMFLFFGLGGIQAGFTAETNSGEGGLPVIMLLYIATSMGLSLLVSAWLFYRVTGSLFNPNVALGLLLIGAIGPLRFVLFCIAQLIGSIVAVALLKGLLPVPITVACAPGLNVSLAQATFIEMFITSALVLCVMMLAAEKHATTPFAPIGIGLTLFAGHLFAVIYTGAAMNTARAFGPAVVNGFTSNHWVYWVGPFLGSILAAAFYAGLKHYDYLTLNPGQDADHPDMSPADPIERIRSQKSSNGDNGRSLV